MFGHFARKRAPHKPPWRNTLFGQITRPQASKPFQAFFMQQSSNQHADAICGVTHRRSKSPDLRPQEKSPIFAKTRQETKLIRPFEASKHLKTHPQHVPNFC